MADRCYAPLADGTPPPREGWSHCRHWRDGGGCCACGDDREVRL